MKLISLNVEGERHFDRVQRFLTKQKPDVICFQEAAEAYVEILAKEGFHVSYLPRTLKQQEGGVFTDGILIATNLPHESTRHYYFEPQPELLPESVDQETFRSTNKQGVLVATISETDMSIATTHFTWAPDARRDWDFQQNDLEALLSYLNTQPPHILCGDLNLSRAHSKLYTRLCENYTDTIPKSYECSMDKSLHRYGNDPTADYVFTDLMVDYALTQPPYIARDVRLEFGISDHAAIITTIEN